MIGWQEEYDSQIRLVVQAYLELKKSQPNHPLLSLITLDEDHKGFTPVSDFNTRCLPEGFLGEHPDIYAMGHYGNALGKARLGLPFELPPKTTEQNREAVFYESLDELVGNNF